MLYLTDHAFQCQRVFHAVGPQWRGGDKGEPALLSSLVKKILKEAQDKGLQTIAMPLISVGTYNFPKDLACQVQYNREPRKHVLPRNLCISIEPALFFGILT